MTRRRLRLTRVVSTLGLFGGLCLLAACQFPPTAPTPPCVVVGSGSGTPTPVMVDIGHCGPANILHNQPGSVTAGGGTGGDGGSGTGGDGGTGGEGGEGAPPGDDSTGNPPSGPASIITSGSNDDGAVIYQIGPGQVFTRTGGDAATVWCRPASDCNGEGGNRTAVNAASPPSAWIEDASAVFRRSGTMGTTVTFTVDDQPLTHEF